MGPGTAGPQPWTAEFPPSTGGRSDLKTFPGRSIWNRTEQGDISPPRCQAGWRDEQLPVAALRAEPQIIPAPLLQLPQPCGSTRRSCIAGAGPSVRGASRTWLPEAGMPSCFLVDGPTRVRPAGGEPKVAKVERWDLVSPSLCGVRYSLPDT